MMKARVKAPEKVWQDFYDDAKLTDEQFAQFQRYEAFLSQKNKEFNLTAIIELTAIVRQHFMDSLFLRKFVDLKSMSTIIDVGAGAGFPLIPLKIMFPHLKIVLIEVTRKKAEFLQDLVKLLELTDVEIYTQDWRTFLRKTEYKVDLFVTRAALQDLELCRAFKPSSPYKNATIVYWATQEWMPDEKTVTYVQKIENYKLGSRNRSLVFLGLGQQAQQLQEQ